MGPELRNYKNKEFPYWAMKYRPLINSAQVLLKDWLEAGKVLRIEMTVTFEWEKIFTKKDAPKKIDGSNRMKAFHDCLSDVLGIDDSYFFEIALTKKGGSKPKVDCKITPIDKVLNVKGH